MIQPSKPCESKSLLDEFPEIHISLYQGFLRGEKKKAVSENNQVS